MFWVDARRSPTLAAGSQPSSANAIAENPVVVGEAFHPLLHAFSSPFPDGLQWSAGQWDSA